MFNFFKNREKELITKIHSFFIEEYIDPFSVNGEGFDEFTVACSMEYAKFLFIQLFAKENDFFEIYPADITHDQIEKIAKLLLKDYFSGLNIMKNEADFSNIQKEKLSVLVNKFLFIHDDRIYDFLSGSTLSKERSYEIFAEEKINLHKQINTILNTQTSFLSFMKVSNFCFKEVTTLLITNL